jgi:ribosomal protein S18 acetylase RimI-like enzyme
VARLFNAYREFYGRASDLPLATRFIGARLESRDSVILLAEHSDTGVMGFCQLYPSFCSVEAAPIFVLYDLFVAANHRLNGAARALLQAAEVHAASAGCVRMDLSTARSNHSAHALYESLGWIRDDVFFVYNRRVAEGVRP